jgi:hypothetical protein
MIVQTVELGGEALNHAVGKALGWTDYPTDSIEHGSVRHLDPLRTPFGKVLNKSSFKPSTDWVDAGPIIEANNIFVMKNSKDQWVSIVHRGHPVGVVGPTPIVAAMRCFVKSKLGNEVDIPDELLNQGE